MIELEAGEGHNDGPELRLRVQANEIVDLRRALALLSPAQRDIFAQYRPKPTDFEPFLRKQDNFRFTDEWTFARAVA